MSTGPFPDPPRFELWMCTLMIAGGVVWRILDGTFSGIHAVFAGALGVVAVVAVVAMTRRSKGPFLPPDIPDLRLPSSHLPPTGVSQRSFQRGYALAFGLTVLGAMTLAGSQPGFAQGLFAIVVLGLLGWVMLERAIGGA